MNYENKKLSNTSSEPYLLSTAPFPNIGAEETLFEVIINLLQQMEL